MLGEIVMHTSLLHSSVVNPGEILKCILQKTKQTQDRNIIFPSFDQRIYIYI